MVHIFNNESRKLNLLLFILFMCTGTEYSFKEGNTCFCITSENALFVPLGAIFFPFKVAPFQKMFGMQESMQEVTKVFICVEVLWPSQPNGVKKSVISIPNQTFTGQA